MPRMANESGMNKRQIAEFQARLEGWLAELRVAAGQVTREGRELVDESALDVADRAVNSATKEFLFRQAHDRHRMSHLVASRRAYRSHRRVTVMRSKDSQNPLFKTVTDTSCVKTFHPSSLVRETTLPFRIIS